MNATLIAASFIASTAAAAPDAPEQGPRQRSFPCATVAPDDTVSVDTEGMPLEDFVRFVACARSLNVVVREDLVGGKEVRIVAPRPVRGRDLLPLLHLVLTDNGLELVRTGSFHRLQPLAPPAQPAGGGQSSSRP